ncbi:MAG: hypothetical protein IJO43_02760 [Bacilli bacterium]|nr:hypothetical protein [Bacilli bacterium]
MKKSNEYVVLEYTECDSSYINELVDHINLSSKEIVDFFDGISFQEKANIKLFDNLDAFRNSCMKIWGKKEAPAWLCGLTFKMNNYYNIYTLNLEEYKKTEGHNKHTLTDLKQLIIHEFVHVCHRKYTNDAKLMVWLSEGLATTLSHQYDGCKDSFDATLEQMISGGTKYKNYYMMFSYVLTTYGRNYILKLLENKEYLSNETPRLYEEVINYYSK